MKRIICFLSVIALLSCAQLNAKKPEKNLRLLYWNIQNGMWSEQGCGYAKFVKWVSDQKPDICVWCEGQSHYKTGSDEELPENERYLVANWSTLAARYGHNYTYVGGHRDNYPQVITSKYPIENVERILGNVDTLVAHGSSWARIKVNGKTLNIVTVHTWPQAYSYYAQTPEAKEKSKAEFGGNYFRRTEIEYICHHTIDSVSGAKKQLWMMMGDFNSRSIVDSAQYKHLDPSFYLVHNYVRENTPYLDVIEKTRTKYVSSTYSGNRIDFIYVTPKLLKRVKDAQIVWDDYTTPVLEPHHLRNFKIPSDHLPIIVDFKL
jgi:endonuclease/exonuclease/phosphatase family metal-dependent hydrolase